MDRLFIWLTLGMGALVLSIIMYFVIQNLYQRLKLVAHKWIDEHPNEVDEIRILLDDLSCAIHNGAERLKLRLIGKSPNGNPTVIVTDVVLKRREFVALHERELKERMILST